MKKRVITILSLALIIVIIIAIAILLPQKPLKELDTMDGITMTIEQSSLTNSSATIVINSKLEETYNTGRDYRIDKNKNGKWYRLKAKQPLVTTMESNIINQEYSHQEKLNWSSYYGALEPGKYRIVKWLNKEDGPNNNEKYIACEFEIN